MSVSDKIRKIRKDNNLTQEEFANIINVSRSALVKYEDGTRKPPLDIIKTICDKFNISIDYLINDILKTKDERKSRIKSFNRVVMSLMIMSSTLIACRMIEVKVEYGYNIYNDELKVKNSDNILIAKVTSLISENKEENIYGILPIKYLKRDIDEFNFRNLKTTIVLKYELNEHYLLIFNNLNVSVEKENKLYNFSKIEINDSPFIIELPEYNENLEYNKQTGKCKSTIDYYESMIK